MNSDAILDIADRIEAEKPLFEEEESKRGTVINDIEDKDNILPPGSPEPSGEETKDYTADRYTGSRSAQFDYLLDEQKDWKEPPPSPKKQEKRENLN